MKTKKDSQSQIPAGDCDCYILYSKSLHNESSAFTHNYSQFIARFFVTVRPLLGPYTYISFNAVRTAQATFLDTINSSKRNEANFNGLYARFAGPCTNWPLARRAGPVPSYDCPLWRRWSSMTSSPRDATPHTQAPTADQEQCLRFESETDQRRRLVDFSSSVSPQATPSRVPQRHLRTSQRVQLTGFCLGFLTH